MVYTILNPDLTIFPCVCVCVCVCVRARARALAPVAPFFSTHGSLFFCPVRRRAACFFLPPPLFLTIARFFSARPSWLIFVFLSFSQFFPARRPWLVFLSLDDRARSYTLRLFLLMCSSLDDRARPFARRCFPCFFSCFFCFLCPFFFFFLFPIWGGFCGVPFAPYLCRQQLVLQPCPQVRTCV